MTTRAFSRRARLDPPAVPAGELPLEPPPELPRVAPVNLMTYVMPGAMVVMVVGFVVVGGLNAASIMMGAMMLMMTLGMIGSGRSASGGRAQLDAERHDYLAYLARLRGDVGAVRDAQRASATFTHPSPDTLWSLAGGRRMWERRRTDADHGWVRLGTGTLELATPLLPPQTAPVGEVDPICAVALSRFLDTHSIVDDLPQTLALADTSVLALGGDPEAARALARAVVCEAATFHGPDTLAVVAVAGPGARARWDWLKWLPHAQHPTLRDGLGPVRLVVSSFAEAEELLAGELDPRPLHTADGVVDPAERHVLIVVDGAAGPDPLSPFAGPGLRGVTIVDLDAALPGAGGAGRVDVVVRPGRLGLGASAAEATWVGEPDGLDLAVAESVARGLAPYRTADAAADDDAGTPGGIGSGELADMLGIGDVATITADQVWRPRTGRDLLRVPIGVGPGGEAVELDLKESALGGMGPHGLVIGATGSGKSELLRTLVLALACTHSPDQLNLVLVDFKGGATFLGLHDLPHTAAVITNLQDDLTLVDRMYDALSGELNRRQEILRDAGNLANVREYERLRATSRPDLAPLPWLVVVCDEFSEMLTQKPDFAELFAAIGRLGRSLGVHLLLASQRLEEGRLRGLDSHLSYRIGLKTFSAQESRAVLGVPDAYELPPIPGSGYLKFDTTQMTRFKAAYVSGPYRGRTGTTARPVDAALARPISFVADRVDLGPAPDALLDAVPKAPAPTPADTAAPSVLDTVVARLEGHGTPAHEVWLPPLDVSPTLAQLLPPLAAGPRGLAPEGTSVGAGLRAVVGVVDLPYEQRRDALVVDFSGAAGNGAVVGGPQSGKSVALRTIITSLALTHTPQQVQFYVVDLGGGSLLSTAGLPHVGGVVTRARPDHLRRAVAEVAGVLAAREVRFRDLGIESMQQYRRLQAAGDERAAGDAFGDVFLVVDGWSALREEFEDLEPRITSIAQRGLSLGVHVIISAGRWAEVRSAIKDTLGTRVELRLGDAYDSEIDRRAAAAVPAGRPGRGMTNDRHHLLVALPRLDADGDPATLAGAYTDLVAAVADAWTGPAAPPVRTLPEVLPQAQLVALTADAAKGQLPIGINEDALAPVYLDLARDQHLLYLTDTETGRTNLLAVVADAIQRQYTSDEMRMLVLDYRRGLLGVIPDEYLAGYAASSTQASGLLTALAAMLRERIPGPDVTPAQLRARSWWQGREVVVLVDDHDLTASGENPLVVLRDLVPMARDIGLHLVVTRRASGAGRALYDPLLQAMRDAGAPVLVGAGPRDEGALAGTARPDPSFPPGRARLVRREGTQLVQLALAEPSEPSGD